MKRFRAFKTDYKGKIPRIITMCNGYKLLKKGLCLVCNGKGLVLIRPFYER